MGAEVQSGRCAVCGGPTSTVSLPQGFVFCQEGHVLTVAPIFNIDPRTLATIAVTGAGLTGDAANRERVSAWEKIEG